MAAIEVRQQQPQSQTPPDPLRHYAHYAEGDGASQGRIAGLKLTPSASSWAPGGCGSCGQGSLQRRRLRASTW
jgi:hypothetical protein